MRNLIIIMAVMLAVPAFGQRKRGSDSDAAPAFTEGITYALPRTGVRIHVEAIKETFEPGPYARYASQLLGLNEVQTEAAVRWKIRDVQFEAFSEPDPAHVYKAMGDAAFLLDLTASGVLAGVNSGRSQQEKLIEKTITYIGDQEKDQATDFSRYNHSPAYAQGDSSNNFRPVRIGDEEKAVEAAKRILESRNTRYYISAGLMDEFHPDGKAYEVSIRELEETEKGYMSLFTGKTTYERQQFSFNFIPSASSEKGDVVFRFSEDGGVVPSTDLSGKPVLLRVEAEKALTSKYSGLASSDNPNAGSSGLYYRMPAMADINLIYEMSTIASTRMVLPQFGQVAPVPEELLFGDYRIEIHPETGAIKSVSRK